MPDGELIHRAEWEHRCQPPERRSLRPARVDLEMFVRTALDCPRRILGRTLGPPGPPTATQDQGDIMSEDRLYGFDGHEYPQTTLETVYENWECDWDDVREFLGAGHTQLEIFEWTTIPVSRLLPDASDMLEWVKDRTADDLGFEEAFEALANACDAPEVIEAARGLMASIARNWTGFKLAEQHVATHIVTWDENLQPLVNGEPMYVMNPATGYLTAAPKDGSA